MTVFPNRTKEALHGHNYMTEVSIRLKDISLKNLVSFAYFKELLEEICSEWDSKVLIAKNCPFLEIKAESKLEFEFVLCGKRYVLPRDEVALLEIENISVECLADLFCQRFLDRLDPGLLDSTIAGVQVKIEETPGQGATLSWSSEARNPNENRTDFKV